MAILIRLMLVLMCALAIACSQDSSETPTQPDDELTAGLPTQPDDELTAGLPTQHDVELTAELLEEMYWIYVDTTGQSLDIPEINRELEFEEAQFFVGDFLFKFYELGLREIESYGIEPFSTWPYCINAISGAVHNNALFLAESPSEAAPHIMAMTEIIAKIRLEISPARERAGQPNNPKCDEFELEKTKSMHRTSGQ